MPPETCYVDTSAWIAVFAQEATARQVASALTQPEVKLVSSEWTRTEVASAMAAKLRGAFISPEQFERALAAFERWVQNGLELLTVEPEDFSTAASMCADSASKLRAGDALHLSVALRHGVTQLLSLDKNMMHNATRLGITLAHTE